MKSSTRNMALGLVGVLGLGLLAFSKLPRATQAQESRVPQSGPTAGSSPASAEAKAPAKSSKEQTATAKSEAPVKNEAPAKSEAPAKNEAPAKSEASAKSEAPQQAAPAVAALDPLRQGSVLRPTRELVIGLSGVYEDGGETYAWFNAGTRAFTYAVEVQVGQRVRVGGFELEVLEIDLEERWVRYAWISKDATVPATKKVAAQGELRLREMGVYPLASGEVLTVGNVNALGKVTIRVFPKTYASDPMQGYDNHVEAQAGAVFKGVRALRLVETSISAQTQAGWVKIQLR
jgi:hypothetical protein